MSDDAPALLAACTEALAGYFQDESRALLAAAREPLLVAARDAGDRDEEDRLLSVLEEVEALTPEVTDAFCTAMLATLNDPGRPAERESDTAADAGGLTLVETAKADDWLRLRGMLERQGEDARQVEAQLWERLAALTGVELHPDSNPVSLQYVCAEFQAAMQGFAPGRDARAAIYDAFEATVAARLGRLAARLQSLLDADAAELPPAPAPDRAGEDTGAATAENSAGGATRATADLAVDPARMLGAMAGVQRRELDSPMAGLDNLDERLLEAIAPPHRDVTLDEGERRTVAAVARLVRGVVEDPDVAPGLQRRLSQLAPPLLLLALQDEGYLEAEMLAARHDPVTGLFDRAAFRSRLESAFRRSAKVAVCLVDVDGFGEVRRRLGHQVGGRLLRALADVLRKQAGRRNVVARLRGDEFAVLLADGKPGAGRRFSDRFLVSLSEARFVFDGEKVELHASVGVVESAGHFDSAGELMRAADSARNAAKADGGGCVRIATAG